MNSDYELLKRREYPCMNPSEFAQEELGRWQAALTAQHEAEQKALEARAAGNKADFARFSVLAERLRVRADEFLAEAIRLKCAYRDSVGSKLQPESQRHRSRR